MTRVVGVRFKNNGRVYYFDPGELEIQPGDGVIVETARGTEFGDVSLSPAEVPDEQVVQPLKPVLRVATEADRAMRDANTARESEAFAVCQRKIAQHKLDMKLVDVEYTFNGSKVIFYFTADERVDFRELVKDLAGHFKTRIELRQIGVRDEARMLGGLGSCGRPVCCKTFLDDFRPVSIKMAKEQNLSLSPTKISGLCGRLMCCLQYEQAAYEEMKKLMPKTGKEIQTPDGNGIAVENNAITERTKVKLALPDGTYDLRWYHYTELAKIGDPPPKARERVAPDSAAPSLADYVAPEGSTETPRVSSRRRRAGAKGDGDRQQPVRQGGAASAEGARQAAVRSVPDGMASPAPQKSRRRRRPSASNGGAAAGQSAQQNGNNGDAAKGQGATPSGNANSGTAEQKRRPPRKAPAGQALSGGMQPPATAQPVADGAADAPKKPRRRRRGGANRNRPRPEGGAPVSE